MKKILITIFQILVAIVLIGKISNWFLDYSQETNETINTAMYILIGISYLYVGFLWKKTITKFIFLICGLYLIGVNFMGEFALKSILGIFSMLTPIIIERFSKREEESLSED